MFKLNSLIENTNHSFVSNKEYVYILLKDKTVVKYNIRKKSNIWVSEVLQGATIIGFLGDQIYCNCGYTSLFIDIQSGAKLQKNDYRVDTYFTNSNKYLAHKIVGDSKVLSLIDKNTQLNCWDIETELGNPSISSGNYFFSEQFLTGQLLNAYHLKDFSKIWQFNIAPYSKYVDARKEICESIITNIFGVYNDNLWIGITSGKIFALDIYSGKLNYELGFNECDFTTGFNFSISEESGIVPYGDHMQLDQGKGELFGLCNKHYMRIDLKQAKPRMEYFDIGQSMDLHKMESKNQGYTIPSEGKYIYFCDKSIGKIGVFDREKLEVIWSYELEMKRAGIAQIMKVKYENEHLFVLDRNNTLHIFEKE